MKIKNEVTKDILKDMYDISHTHKKTNCDNEINVISKSYITRKRLW